MIDIPLDSPTSIGYIIKDKNRPAIVESYKEENKSAITLIAKSLSEEESKKSNSTNNFFEPTNDAKKDTKDSKDSKINSRDYITHSFSEDKIISDAYIEYRVSQLANNLILSFSEWEKYGTENSYANISSIKDMLEGSFEYLVQKDETRILLGALEFIFENNNWENITQGQLKVFISELGRFKDGKVSWKSLRIFSQQIHRNRLILYNDMPQKEKKENTY